MRLRLIFSLWLILAKSKIKAPRAFIIMKNASEIISKKALQFSLFSKAVSSIELPKSLSITEYSTLECIKLKGYCSYGKAKKMTDSLRKALGGSAILGHYWLSSNHDKNDDKIDTLFVSYSFGPLGSSDRVEVDFEISSPNATLKALGVKCRVKMVKKEASVVVTEASETRKVVCPLSA
tara:strand:+ start:190 stop:726 length:537 start_codon:yes stop_codon:yes gene_type:complete